MKITYGNKRANKVFYGYACVSENIINQFFELWVDSIGKSNNSDSHDKWHSLNQTDRYIELHGFKYNNTSGWLDNCLHLDGIASYIEYTFDGYVDSDTTLSVAFSVPTNGSIYLEFPNIKNVYTRGNDLILYINDKEEIIKGVIKYNTFNNLTISISSKLNVYLNGKIIHSVEDYTKFDRDNLSMGKQQDIYHKCNIYGIKFYAMELQADQVYDIYEYDDSRYNFYYPENKVLDIRGYHNLINYGGDKCTFDYSTSNKYLECNNFKIHIPKSGFILFDGTNWLELDSHIVDGSFTIQTLFGNCPHMFINDTVLFSLYKDYGIACILNLDKIIFKVYNDDANIVEIPLALDYTNKYNALTISYDNTNNILCIYVDDKLVLTKENISIRCANNISIGHCESLGDNFKGKINSFRVYSAILESDTIINNNGIDTRIYK